MSNATPAIGKADFVKYDDRAPAARRSVARRRLPERRFGQIERRIHIDRKVRPEVQQKTGRPSKDREA